MEFNGQQIQTIVLPKGTLLFRAVKHAETDLVGADLADRFCIPMNYNVFFYTTPHVVDGIHWFNKGFPTIEAYVTPHELTIVSFVEPSKLTRSARNDKNSLVEACSAQKACLKGREYDPCFKPEFLKKYSHVHGWMAVAAADSKEVVNAIKQGKLAAKNVLLVRDARGVEGPAEIALYPLRTRVLEDLYVEHPEEWKSRQRNEYNYKHVASLRRNCADRDEFMKAHARLDAQTGFYMYRA